MKKKPNWNSPEDLEKWKYCEWLAGLDQSRAMKYFQSEKIPLTDVIRFLKGSDKAMIRHFDIIFGQAEEAREKARPFVEARSNNKNTTQYKDFKYWVMEREDKVIKLYNERGGKAELFRLFTQEYEKATKSTFYDHLKKYFKKKVTQ
ncbi:MAG: hypothetical protein JNN04_07420 [Cyclobacteriaceae bacterium]|nr:hypothetical protein [Cyclobacteriaceae bacterium]